MANDSRVEDLLNAAINGSGTDNLDPPLSRNEKLLYALNERIASSGGSGGLPEGGTPYQQLVTDGEGNAKWEDKPFYEEIAWQDFTLSMSNTKIEGVVLPDVGGTVSVKIDGIVSVETVKSAELEGATYSYIGNADLSSILTGGEGWCVCYFNDACVGYANPQITVSLQVNVVHKIDNKFVNQDTDFVRILGYYIGKSYTLYKLFYNTAGDELVTYKCSSIIIPTPGTLLLLDVGYVGIAKTNSSGLSSFAVTCYALDGSEKFYIFGTDESDIETLAAMYGYTLTTKPTA